MLQTTKHIFLSTFVQELVLWCWWHWRWRDLLLSVIQKSHELCRDQRKRTLSSRRFQSVHFSHTHLTYFYQHFYNASRSKVRKSHWFVGFIVSMCGRVFFIPLFVTYYQEFLEHIKYANAYFAPWMYIFIILRTFYCQSKNRTFM